MKPETPARNICKLADFPDAAAFRVVCECTGVDHHVDTWIEVDKLVQGSTDILVTFYVHTHSHPYTHNLWQRIKNAYNVLFGNDLRCQEMILTEQQALNWTNAVQHTIKVLRKNEKHNNQ